MAQNDVAAWACVGLVLTFVLGIILLALYLLTEGVEGIGRRLYAMLLLLMSALVAGFVIGVPILLCMAAVSVGLFLFAAAVGIPFATLVTYLAVGARAAQFGSQSPSLDERDVGNSWLNAYLKWIKRVARGEKRTGRRT